MYCPYCNHPLLGTPEVCPNCGQNLESSTTPEDIRDEHRTGAAQTGGSPTAGGEPPRTDRMLVVAAILAAMPLIGLVFSALTFLVRNIGNLQVIFNMIAGLFFLGSLLGVPAALIMSIVGFRRARRTGSGGNRTFALIIMVFSGLIVIAGIVGGTLLIRNIDKITQLGVESVKSTSETQIRSGIERAAEENRDADRTNDFGTYYPATLDNADTNSVSGRDNPFFTKVLNEPVVLPVWKKGPDMNEYTLLDTIHYRYDPAEGTFTRIRKQPE